MVPVDYGHLWKIPVVPDFEKFQEIVRGSFRKIGFDIECIKRTVLQNLVCSQMFFYKFTYFATCVELLAVFPCIPSKTTWLAVKQSKCAYRVMKASSESCDTTSK